jgi:NAD(P)H-dependent FMN reductase
MPLFAEEASPLYAPSKDEVARRWRKQVGEFDAFIFTAAEYNRGPTAVLKNALDYAYTEWNNKPVAFVGYGGVGGARGRATAAPRPSNCRWRRSAPPFTSCFPITWP